MTSGSITITSSGIVTPDSTFFAPGLSGCPTIGVHCQNQPMRISRALLAMFLLASLPAQEPNQPYFSLSSSKTFAPGEKASIQMWSQNVDSLEFRVYRIRDPILFFQKLEDVHRFGNSEAPRRNNRQLTLIERFHELK